MNCLVPCRGDAVCFGAKAQRLLKTDKITNHWLLFIYNAVNEQYKRNICLCTAHLTEDSLLNLVEYKAGYTQRLLLKSGAIPTLLEQSCASESENVSMFDYFKKLLTVLCCGPGLSCRPLLKC